MLFSVLAAELPLFAAFSVWNLLRMYFALAVVTRLCAAPRVAATLVRGLACGVLVATLSALRQRFGHGAARPEGTFSHPNSLAMAVNLVYPLALALVLARRGRVLARLTVAAAATAVAIAVSRGGAMVFILTGGLVAVASLARGATLRKLVLPVVAALAAGAILAGPGQGLVQRFRERPSESLRARERFERAAAEMVRDHPFGIGANQFSHVLETRGYAQHAGVDAVDRAGIVHNIYWLTAAETGLIGLLAYLLLIAAPLLRALRVAFGGRSDARRDVLLGCATAFVGMYVHGFAEWSARQTSLSYLFWILAGLVAALARQLRTARAPRIARAAA